MPKYSPSTRRQRTSFAVVVPAAQWPTCTSCSHNATALVTIALTFAQVPGKIEGVHFFSVRLSGAMPLACQRNDLHVVAYDSTRPPMKLLIEALPEWNCADQRNVRVTGLARIPSAKTFTVTCPALSTGRNNSIFN